VTFRGTFPNEEQDGVEREQPFPLSLSARKVKYSRGIQRRKNMRFQLTFEERIVLKYLQEEEASATSIDIANRTGLDHHQVREAFASLAEKDLFILEDRTAGELSESGRNYNLFDDESIGAAYDSLRPETRILLDHFIEDPDATPSEEVLKTVDGLKPQEIERAIDELEYLGYPARRRVKP